MNEDGERSSRPDSHLVSGSAVVLEDVVVGGTACDGDLLGEWEELSQRVVGQLMKLCGVVCEDDVGEAHEGCRHRGQQTAREAQLDKIRLLTLWDDERVTFGKRADVEESVATSAARAKSQFVQDRAQNGILWPPLTDLFSVSSSFIEGISPVHWGVKGNKIKLS